jgi:hypothetical protein
VPTLVPPGSARLHQCGPQCSILCEPTDARVSQTYVRAARGEWEDRLTANLKVVIPHGTSPRRQRVTGTRPLLIPNGKLSQSNPRFCNGAEGSNVVESVREVGMPSPHLGKARACACYLTDGFKFPVRPLTSSAACEADPTQKPSTIDEKSQ